MAPHVARRPVQADDLDQLLTLAQAADTVLWGQPETDREELAHTLAAFAPLETASSAVVTPDGIGGYALVRGAECTLNVHPEPTGIHRSRVVAELLAWAAAQGAREVDLAGPDTALHEVATAAGWRHSHSSHELLRTRQVPPPTWPAELELHPFRPEHHAVAVHRMLYAFWAEVPTHHDRPYAQWRQLFVDHPSSHPHLQLVAWQGDEVVGAALTRIFTGETGWILQLGVAPAARRQGLGRALLCHAADRLQATPGVREVGLSVDADNDAALELYRAAGFESDRTYLRFTAQPQTERSSG